VPDSNHTELKVDIASLKKDVKQAKDIHSRLDTAIGKLTDVSTYVKQMLAVHEEKITQQEITDRNLFDLVENRRLKQIIILKKYIIGLILQQKNLKSYCI